MKLFVSDYLLSVSPEERATAASILQTPQMLKWCSKSVDEDKAYIRKHFIDEVDFANQYKLENTAANYDHLESVGTLCEADLVIWLYHRPGLTADSSEGHSRRVLLG